MQIEFSNAEIEYLQRTLTSVLSDLRMEIGGTDSSEMRAALHRDEGILRGLLVRLGAPPEGGASLGG